MLCVYYKVPAARHTALAPQVRQMQARLVAAWPGLQAELLQRPEVAEGLETWMETYRHGAGTTPALAAAVAEAAAAAGLPGPRHVERFQPLV